MSPSRGALIPEEDPEVRERRIAAGLFFVTCCTVFSVYFLRWQEGPAIAGAGGSAWRSMLFTGALMTILLAHEIGHYATARLHGIRLALPWFLPAPILVGTFGAIIRWSDAPRTRGGLLEMGAMGPLAGLAAVVLLVGAWLIAGPEPEVGAHLGGAGQAGAGGVILARPLLWWVLSAVLTGGPPPAISTQDPIGFAAWIGALVTAMNLLPAGQLDGGHVASALWPAWSRAIGWVVTVGLLGMGLLWPGWAVWAAVVALMGRPEAAPRDRRPPDGRARAVAAASAVAWVLCVTPVPVG